MANLDAMPVRLHLRGLRVLEVVEDLPERLVVAVVAVVAWVRCSACGHKCRSVHQVKKVKVRDLPVSGRPTTLLWHQRRFRCQRCGATTTETHPGFDGKLTLRLRRHLLGEVVDSTVAATARRHGLSWHAVMAVVLAAAQVVFFRRRRQRCRVLVVDEKSLVKGHGGFSTIVCDAEAGRVIAVLPGRSQAALARFLAGQSPAWRRGVRIAVTDMAGSYRAAIRAWLPDATHVVDRFHLVRNLLRPLADARRAAQRTALGQPHDPALFRNRYTLLTRADRLSAAQQAELVALFDRHPHLAAAWEMTQRFHRIYQSDDHAAALEAINEFVDAWVRTRADLGAGVRTLLAWADEWLAYHHTGGWTSAVAEGVNNKIEVLERKAYGFRRPVNHQARIVLECAGHRRVNRAVVAP